MTTSRWGLENVFLGALLRFFINSLYEEKQMAGITREQVEQSLKTIIDPNIGKNLVVTKAIKDCLLYTSDAADE